MSRFELRSILCFMAFFAITKNSRAVANECAQAEILVEGTTPTF